MKTKATTYVYHDYNECITIEQSGDGKYWITYGAAGAPYGLDVIYNPVSCGGFETEEEATAAIFKHRPNAKFYGACK